MYGLEIYLGFREAFDRIDHEIFLHSLHNYDIREIIMQCFKSSLWSRKQFTCINGIYSQSSSIKHGVSHDPALWTLHFMMYVDDNIQNASKCIIPKLFAGDINVSVHKDIKLGYALANTDLEPLYRWLEANKLSLSIVEDEDTTYTLFSQNNINMLKRHLHCISQEWRKGFTYTKNIYSKYVGTFYHIRHKLQQICYR